MNTTDLFEQARAQLREEINNFKPPKVSLGEMVYLYRNHSDPKPTAGIVVEVQGRTLSVAEFRVGVPGSITRERCFHRSDPQWRDIEAAQNMMMDEGLMWEKINTQSVDAEAVFKQVAELASRLSDVEDRVHVLENPPQKQKRGPGRPRKNETKEEDE